jgi:outer membrane immunogenic protein
MKKYLLGIVALVGLGAAVGAAPAMAADLAARPYMKAPPAVMAPIYNWTGFYVGGHVGGAWTGSNDIGSNTGRFLGGLQAGADYQFAPNWVVGIEGQYSWQSNSGNNNTAFGVAGLATRNDRGLGSVTGRLGWTWGPGLLYAKGGVAFTDTTVGVTVAGVPVAFATTGNAKTGWTAGAGLEYMFAPNWSVKGEYQYYNFASTAFVAPTPVGLIGQSFRNDEHTFKAGVNYRFGWH